MLNELLAIERSMTAHRIDLAGRHPDVKDMARGPAFRVRLSSTGAIAGVDLVPDAGRGALWTLRDGQHNGFPGLSVGKQARKGEPPAGLVILDEQAWEAHKQVWDGNKSAAPRRAELLRLISTAPLDASLASAWPSAGHRKAVAQRLEALRSLEGDPLTAAVPAAFERFLLALAASPPFLDGFLAALATAVRKRGDEWLEPVQAALVGRAALFIDVPDGDFGRDAGDARQIGPVTATLSARTQGGGDAAAEQAGSCALSGRTGNLHSGNFPQPNLPSLGQTYIFARNKDIPSLTRYGCTADASFPIDSDLVCRLSGAITALTREDAKGRSWRLIPAEAGDRPDLLVTSLDARLADALAGDEDDDAVDGQGAWNELGRRLIAQTRGAEAGPSPLDEVVILVLRTVDRANYKAIYHRNTTSGEIWQAARRWEGAAANLPGWLEFKLPAKRARVPVFKAPPFVKPLSITPLSRVQFANGGRRRVPVAGVTAADAFGLFLQEGDVEARAQSPAPLAAAARGPARRPRGSPDQGRRPSQGVRPENRPASRCAALGRVDRRASP